MSTHAQTLRSGAGARSENEMLFHPCTTQALTACTGASTPPGPVNSGGGKRMASATSSTTTTMVAMRKLTRLNESATKSSAATPAMTTAPPGQSAAHSNPAPSARTPQTRYGLEARQWQKVMNTANGAAQRAAFAQAG